MTELVPPVGIGLAFLAGVVYFLSPCCAPLVPGYLSYISGTAFDRKGELKPPFLRILSYTVLFILGFTLVFVSLGTSASALGFFLESYRRELIQIAGMVMIIMGILIMGIIPLPFLSREFRLHPDTRKLGLWGNIPLGMAFALGWMPCVGPILASILFYASTTQTVVQGTLLLLVYSLGLGLSFIFKGVFFIRAIGALRWMQRHYRTFNFAGGVLLVLVGLLFVSNPPCPVARGTMKDENRRAIDAVRGEPVEPGTAHKRIMQSALRHCRGEVTSPLRANGIGLFS